MTILNRFLGYLLLIGTIVAMAPVKVPMWRSCIAGAFGILFIIWIECNFERKGDK